MKEFFDDMSIEIRLTLGTSWDNHIAKSVEKSIFKDLCHNVFFDRNTQINKYQNFILQTVSDPPERFNIRCNIGVNMDHELTN